MSQRTGKQGSVARILVTVSLLSVGTLIYQPSKSASAISPESVRKESKLNTPLLFVDVTDSESKVTSTLPDPRLKVVFFSRKPVIQPARKAAQLMTSNGHAESYWLGGTPLDWQRLELRLGTAIDFHVTQRLSAKELSAAIKDRDDLQIIDLRSSPDYQEQHIPGSQNILPHKVEAALANLSKLRWIVLIDGDGRVAGPIADQVLRGGYHLVCILDGGYRAWVAEPDK